MRRPPLSGDAPGSSLNQTRAARLLPSLAAALLFAWLAYVVIVGAPHFEPSAFAPALRLHLLYLALGIAYLAYLAAQRRLPGSSPLDLPVAALLLVYAVAILGSVSPRVSFEASLLVGTAIVTFYVFHDARFVSTEALVRGFVLVMAFVAAYALERAASAYVQWFDLLHAVDPDAGYTLPPTILRIQGVGDHVNILAMALNLGLPFALALFLHPPRSLDRILGAVSLPLMLLALFFTVSRGAWLGTLVALPVFVTLFALRGRDLGEALAPLQRTATAHRALVIAFAAGAIVVLAASIAGLSQWESRPAWLFRSSLSPRYDAVSTGLDIFRDRPWFGAGPYTYSQLYDTYSSAYPIENIHPHNGYLNALVDTGLAGAIVLLAGAYAVVASLWQAYRIGDHARRTLVGATAAALTTLSVHAFLDTPNVWDSALLPFVVVLSIGLRLSGPSNRSGRVFTLARATPVLVVAVMVAGWLFIDRATSTYTDSLTLLGEGKFAEAATAASAAADRDEGFAAYHLNAGVSHAISYLVAGESASHADLDATIAELRRAVELDPRSAIGYANLALAYRLAEDEPAAVEAAFAALARAGSDGTIGAVAGTVFEWAGRDFDAVQAYTLALSHDAGLVQSPFWEQTELRFGARRDALAASTLTDCEKGRVSAMYRGYPDDLDEWARGCRLLIDGDPGDARARSDLAVILHVLGRNDEALAEAREAVRHVPDNPFARTAFAIVLGREGDVSRVRHELMLGAYLGDPDAAILLAYTYAPPAGPDPLLDNLGLPVDPAPVPASVLTRLTDAVPASSPMVYDNGVQRYLLGILYYRASFLRQSPTTILIPGEWQDFTSPRASFILGALSVP